MRKILLLLLCLCSFFACKKNTKDSPKELFFNEENLVEIKCYFNADSLGLIETLLCNDSSLIVFDYHSGNSFTIFDLKSEKYIGRFGEIGQGPGEIPLGCYGCLNYNDFIINYDFTGLIAKYPIDSLRSNIRFRPLKLSKYDIIDAHFSRVIPINDSLFLGAGTYQSNFQFALFNKKSEIIDFNVEIFNASNKIFNIFHKYLSNQGIFKKHPTQNKFVYAVNYSSNIDFVEVVNDKIQMIKSIRLRNPKITPLQDGKFNRIIPNNDNSIGYIDIATSDNYVYTLYTDKKIIGENGKNNSFSSNIVLVFDWDGNPVKILYLKHEAYFITVSKMLKKMYVAIINDDLGWDITSYKLDNP
jgi:hypothetical protein